MDVRLSVCKNSLAVLISGGSWDFPVKRMRLGLLRDESEGLNTAIFSGQALSHLCLAYVAGLNFLTCAYFLLEDD
jgi:hypothetical protein